MRLLLVFLILVQVGISQSDEINTSDAILCDYGSFVHRVDADSMGRVTTTCKKLPDLACNRKDKPLKAAMMKNSPVTCNAKWVLKCPDNYFVAGIKPIYSSSVARIDNEVFCCTFAPLQSCQSLRQNQKKLRPGRSISFARQNSARKIQYVTKIVTASRTDIRVYYSSLSICPTLRCKRKRNNCF